MVNPVEDQTPPTNFHPQDSWNEEEKNDVVVSNKENKPEEDDQINFGGPVEDSENKPNLDSNDENLNHLEDI